MTSFWLGGSGGVKCFQIKMPCRKRAETKIIAGCTPNASSCSFCGTLSDATENPTAIHHYRTLKRKLTSDKLHRVVTC
ncbi:hypothetical protein CEXT_449191 [Caerostris extrusa]|uniref:Uncharacterized protein n=1 Tax=Caerostris extrusa TaxID=172846 RepID=A0AAV4XMT2_CAEEX|nr:hypothetical protein CEXT_449191 [Caerostris extrusa]